MPGLELAMILKKHPSTVIKYSKEMTIFRREVMDHF